MRIRTSWAAGLFFFSISACGFEQPTAPLEATPTVATAVPQGPESVAPAGTTRRREARVDTEAGTISEDSDLMLVTPPPVGVGDTGTPPAPSEPQFCQDQAILSGVGYQTQCAGGTCDCRAEGQRWSCVDDGRACEISNANGTVEGACCEFATHVPGPGLGTSTGPHRQCNASNRTHGERFDVVCQDGHCICSRNQVAVGSCEEPTNDCDLRSEGDVIHAGCCAFSL